MAQRQWAVLAADYGTEEEFRGAVTEELARLENIGHRLGGAFVATPIRRELEPEERSHPQVREHVTDGWVFQYETAPAVRRQPAREPARAADPEPDELEAALAVEAA
jgi:hypothetical protein